MKKYLMRWIEKNLSPWHLTKLIWRKLKPEYVDTLSSSIPHWYTFPKKLTGKSPLQEYNPAPISRVFRASPLDDSSRTVDFLQQEKRYQEKLQLNPFTASSPLDSIAGSAQTSPPIPAAFRGKKGYNWSASRRGNSSKVILIEFWVKKIWKIREYQQAQPAFHPAQAEPALQA